MLIRASQHQPSRPAVEHLHRPVSTPSSVMALKNACAKGEAVSMPGAGAGAVAGAELAAEGGEGVAAGEAALWAAAAPGLCCSRACAGRPECAGTVKVSVHRISNPCSVHSSPGIPGYLPPTFVPVICWGVSGAMGAPKQRLHLVRFAR